MEFAHRTALQINIYPLDLPHLRASLSNQLKMWGAQVDAISITLDIRRSSAGRYRGDRYDEYLGEMRTLLAALRVEHPTLSVSEVDYSDAARAQVAARYFRGGVLPDKAWDGGPFYSYFYGLYAADARYIFHIDGDMLFGGGSQRWIEEAIAYMEQHPDTLLMAPLAGPPHPGQASAQHRLQLGGIARVLPHSSTALEFDHVSTRVFFMDMQRFAERVGAVDLQPLSTSQRLKAKLLGHPPIALEAENLLSSTMRRRGLHRVDLLGEGAGMWSLHPPFRSPQYYRDLPAIIARIEAGDVPSGQLGDHNLNDSMIDWSSARAQQTFQKRMLRHFKHVVSRR
ncbi:capsular biosynthesis protein [Duganella sp. P38]|jgi:hypothetical protein|uniref:capsular biosynthesis protein n=1 Tax=Duganella sp. P38 TaxID=3423949 RepID=UPI003D7B9FC6